MKITYTKTPLDWSSEYRIDLVLPARVKGDPVTRACLGYVRRGSWGQGVSDTRWEFHSCPAGGVRSEIHGDFRSLEIKGNAYAHPLGDTYPDTLSDAKSHVDSWLWKAVAFGAFGAASRDAYAHLRED